MFNKLMNYYIFVVTLFVNIVTNARDNALTKVY